MYRIVFEKVVSLFEEHTDIIVKGFRDVQYGHKINLSSDGKGYIACLAIGMAVSLLILLWIQDELSYDRFLKNADRIFRIISADPTGGEISWSAGSPSPIGPTLVGEYPEVKNFTRVQCGWTGWYLHYGDKNFMDERMANADPSFFEMFSFPLVRGSIDLKANDQIVLTEEYALKYFGNENPIGKVLTLSYSNGYKHEMKVTGIAIDHPFNSSIRFNLIASSVISSLINKNPANANDTPARLYFLVLFSRIIAFL